MTIYTKNSTRQGLLVILSRMLRDTLSSIAQLVKGQRVSVRTIQIPARSLREYDLIPEFGGDRVVQVDRESNGEVTIHMIGVDGTNPWLVTTPADRILEIRPVTRGYHN